MIRSFGLPVLLFTALALGEDVPPGGIRFRLPVLQDTDEHIFFDANGTDPGCLSWQCDTQACENCASSLCRTYDKHKGTDFPLPIGTPVYAAADGFLIDFNDAETERCCPCSICPACADCSPDCAAEINVFGNFVRIDHGSGVTSSYFHLGTVSVADRPFGSYIKCGEQIGTVGLTGLMCGTNPQHLHFEVQEIYKSFDPYAVSGGCSDRISAWVHAEESCVEADDASCTPAPCCQGSQELVQDGSFAGSPSLEWSMTGDFRIEDNENYPTCKAACCPGIEGAPTGGVCTGLYAVGCPLTCPGHAVIADGEGAEAGAAAGSLSQTVEIPGYADRALLSYWYRVTSGDDLLPTVFATLQIRTPGGGLLAAPVGYHFQDESDGYKREEVDLSEYIGQEIELRFVVDSTGLTPKTFEVDSVSLKIYGDEQCLDDYDCDGDETCSANCPGPECDDGDPCNGEKTCLTGVCRSRCKQGEWYDRSQAQCVAYGNGDADSDNHVNLRDYSRFIDCFRTAGVAECIFANLACDHFITLEDFLRLYRPFSLGLRVTDGSMRVTAQPSGASATSDTATLIFAAQARDVPLCVNRFKSLASIYSLADILALEENQDVEPLRTVWDGTVERAFQDDPFIISSGSTHVSLAMRVPEKFKDLTDYSPYKVTVGVCGSKIKEENIDLLFSYEVYGAWPGP